MWKCLHFALVFWCFSSSVRPGLLARPVPGWMAPALGFCLQLSWVLCCSCLECVRARKSWGVCSLPFTHTRLDSWTTASPNGQTQDIQSQPADQAPAQPQESIGQRFKTNDGYIDLELLPREMQDNISTKRINPTGFIHK